MGNFELDTDFDKLEEERILEEILNKRLAQLSGNKKYKNLLDVFRNRFDFFEKLILLYKANKNITKDTGDTAYKDIKESLVLMGYIPNVNSISNAIVGNYLSTVRDERELARVNNRKHKSKNKIEEQSKVENSNLSSPSVENKSESNVYTKENDWHDRSWIREEPKDWSIFCLPSKQRPKDGEWSDYWENVWRWLFKMGKEEYKMSSFDLSNYAGYKKAMGSDFGDLWLDLSKVRSSEKNKDLKLNPKDVGKH